MSIKRKIMASLAATCLAVAALVGGVAPAANAAGGATVCGAGPGVYYIGVQGVAWDTFIYNYECRSGVLNIGPPYKSGHCYRVWGGATANWCGSSKLYLTPGRTYWVKYL